MTKKKFFNAATLFMAAIFFAIFTMMSVPNADANMKLNKVHKKAGLNCGKCHHKIKSKKPKSKKCGDCHGTKEKRKALHKKCKSCHKSSQKKSMGKYLKSSSKCKKCHK